LGILQKNANHENHSNNMHDQTRLIPIDISNLVAPPYCIKSLENLKKID